jgi:hypothetical protein
MIALKELIRRLAKHLETAGSLARAALLREKFRYRTEWTITKYANDADFAAGRAYEVCPLPGNILVNAGLGLMIDLLIGAGGTVYSNANAYLGVGDSSTAEGASQTDLQATTNKVRKAMSASYPARSSQTVTFRAAFGSSDANHAWNEFAVFNASTGGTMLNRKVSSQGTKASGQTWTLDLAITFS